MRESQALLQIGKWLVQSFYDTEMWKRAINECLVFEYCIGRSESRVRKSRQKIRKWLSTKCCIHRNVKETPLEQKDRNKVRHVKKLPQIYYIFYIQILKYISVMITSGAVRCWQSEKVINPPHLNEWMETGAFTRFYGFEFFRFRCPCVMLYKNE